MQIISKKVIRHIKNDLKISSDNYNESDEEYMKIG